LIGLLLETKDVPSYDPVKKAVTLLSNYAKVTAKKFTECLDVQTRLKLMHGETIMGLFDPQVTLEEKYKLLFTITENMLSSGRKAELNYTLECISLLARAKLFEPCVGEISECGERYDWKYTEWEFLQHSQFTFTQDGRLGITDIVGNNPAYKRHYINGGRAAGKLESEMRHMSKIIGLEFDTDSDFKHQIIFTRKCTEDLKAKGLHISAGYFKELLAIRNLCQAGLSNAVLLFRDKAPEPASDKAEQTYKPQNGGSHTS
jgi:hypothetical protein